MKKILIFSLFMTFLAGNFLMAQTTPTKAATEKMEQKMGKKDGPVMTLESLTVDYGTIKQHSDPLRTVKFTNTGTEPLVIKNARGSCGCTVPKWSKEPVMPGEESVIEIRYATNRLGKINKTVTITTNEGGKPHVIKVIGKVLKAEKDETVPTAEPSIIKGGN